MHFLRARPSIAPAERELYGRLGSYAELAKRTGLDLRTARKYVESATSG